METSYFMIIDGRQAGPFVREELRHGLSASGGGRGGLPQHPALRRTSVHHRSRPAARL